MHNKIANFLPSISLGFLLAIILGLYTDKDIMTTIPIVLALLCVISSVFVARYYSMTNDKK